MIPGYRPNRFPGAGARPASELLRLYRFNHHELAHLSLVHELDASRDLGEESVVFDAADVQSRFHARTALPNDDRSAGNKLSAECFEPKPLGIRVAAIS